MAGGKSSRMGSPKGLLPFRGRTIMDEIINTMSCFENLFISANIPRYSVYGLPVVADKYRDIGPMSAIYTALTNSDKDWVMLMPCDMPMADRDVVFTLLDRDLSSKQAIIISDGDKPYPVLGLYHKSALPQVKKQIDSQNYRLRKLLDSMDTEYVLYENTAKLANLNTPRDLRRLTEK